MDDAEVKAFFELVNLDYPGLETVKAAVQSGDYAQAKERIVQYYRTRTKPGWYWKGVPKRGLWSSHDDASADDILARRFTVLTRTVQLGDKVDWAANPVEDREWTWLLNRHQFFQKLGLAYGRTRDERYAADFNDLVYDWVMSNPVPETRGGLAHSWRTIEAGIRMLSSWPASWHFFKDSPSFTTDARILMLKSFTEHAEYLYKYPSGGNWNLMENNGLLHVGALFPEFREAEKWRKTSVERFVSQMNHQVYPDGMQFELTTSYHNVSLWNFMQPVLLSRIADGVDFPEEYIDALVGMQVFNAGMQRPDGMLPMVNDSDLSDQLSRIRTQALELGADKLPGLKPLLEVEPAAESVFFPYSGLFCMRTGSKQQDLYMMMDAGPYGAGHQHEDKLNVEVYAYGRPFVVDPGRFTYTGPGSFFRASGAHNTILVDGSGQNRRGVDRSKWIVSEPAPGCRWISNDGFDYAEGTYEDGYGPENDTSVTHTRKVFFAKPEYWVVIDVLSGEGEHGLEQMWHFMPGEVAVEPGIARTLNADANLSVVRSDGAEARIVEGEDRPILGYYSPSYNIREPSPTAVFTRTCTTPVAFETVLYPSKGDAVMPEVRPVRCLIDGKRPGPGQVSAISIRLPEHEDIFVICHDPEAVGKVKRFLEYEFTGEAIRIRTDLKGKEIGRWELVDG